MLKGKKTRLISLALSITMLLPLAACSGNSTSGGETKAENGKLFADGTQISIMTLSHPSWPYDENWNAWRYIREATGATLKVNAVPASDYITKLSLVMANKSEMPDLIYMEDKISVDDYAMSGALIAIDDYMDEMPNYKKFWDSIPEDEREMRLIRRKSADGKTYYPQNYGTDSRQNIRAWLYRKDIFEKNNLKVPETMDELYQTAVKLKKLYPDSYPMCLRNGLDNITVMGAQWKPDFDYKVYYDSETSTWHYGAIEPEMREMVEFMRKMYAEGLVPPDYLTINSKSWEELMSTDRGFMLPDFVVRVDNFNTPNRQMNPDYTLAAMIPPRATADKGQNLVNKFNVDPKGYIICNTGDDKRIKNALHFMDWMYTDEAATLLGWGKEGETYQMVDGKKKFIRPDTEDIEGKYGLFSYGTYLRVDPKAAVAIASDEQAVSVDLALKYTEKNYNPALWLGFSPEDNKDKTVLNEAILAYTEEMLSKFLYNQEPMSNWDSFVKNLDNMGVKDLLAIYEKTYKNMK